MKPLSLIFTQLTKNFNKAVCVDDYKLKEGIKIFLLYCGYMCNKQRAKPYVRETHLRLCFEESVSGRHSLERYSPNTAAKL